MVICGIICSFTAGIIVPLNVLLMSDVVNIFTFPHPPLSTAERFVPYIGKFCGIGSAMLVVTFLQMFFLTLSAKRQGRRIRLLLFDVSDSTDKNI